MRWKITSKKLLNILKLFSIMIISVLWNYILLDLEESQILYCCKFLHSLKMLTKNVCNWLIIRNNPEKNGTNANIWKKKIIYILINGYYITNSGLWVCFCCWWWFFFFIILKGYSRISQIFKIIHKGINQNRSGYAVKTKN